MKGEFAWDNQQLEPVLITFNRAESLGGTLEAFWQAGLSSMRLHVLDNASTDHTAQVVQDMQRRWPNLQYHCNRYNIGGNANILRAVEISQSIYHWCIGDDDHWFLEDLHELTRVLSENNADIIRLGWQVSDASRGQLIPCQQLVAQENMFFGSVSMISATIIRRSIMAKYLRHAYSNISNFYPQLIPVIMAFKHESLPVYSMRRDLMVHTPSAEAGYFLGDLEWYTVWYKTGLFFKEAKDQARFNLETIHYIAYISQGKATQLPAWLFLIRLVLNFKSLGISQARYLAEIFWYGKGVKKYFILPALVYAILPSFIAKGLREWYCKRHRLSVKDIHRDASR